MSTRTTTDNIHEMERSLKRELRQAAAAVLLLLAIPLGSKAQYITNQGRFLDGAEFISTSRIEAYKTKMSYAGMATMSVDYVHIQGPGHSGLAASDHYCIQINFFERNIGTAIRLKTEGGEVIDLKTNGIQKDPFVQLYWVDEATIKKIIGGRIVKIRIEDSKGSVDREIKDNTFSQALSRCYRLLKRTRAEYLRTSESRKKDFSTGF